jgi:hypothetical protein
VIGKKIAAIDAAVARVIAAESRNDLTAVRNELRRT